MTLASSIPRVGPGARAPLAAFSLTRAHERLLGAVMWIFVACASIGVIEPSPYDFASFVAIPLWLFGGFRLHRSFVVLYFLIVAYAFVGFLALTPYWTDPDATIYQYQTAYLAVTALFFALYVGDRTEARAELILMGFTVGCVIASAAGQIGYFDVAGLAKSMATYGRASGTFKDPNVLGSFIILGALYLTQNLLLARARSALLSTLILAVLVAGIFLSFSRGSWGATIFSMLFMISAAFATAKTSRAKTRILTIAVVAIGIVAIVVLVLLSFEPIRQLFLQRASPVQEYDGGEAGRFGNQLRSLPMLLDRFWGFGPLQFRKTFGLEPHNSYIGAFANAGWMGGLLFILLVVVTSFVGIRLMFRDSPYQRLAQVFVPALTGFFLQAFQIDVDHWRHVWLMIGCVWGLEAGRQKWLAAESRKTAEPV